MGRIKIVHPKLVISKDGFSRRIFVPEVPWGCGCCGVKMNEGDAVYLLKENRKVYCQSCTRSRDKCFERYLLSPSRPEVCFWFGSLEKNKLEVV